MVAIRGGFLAFSSVAKALFGCTARIICQSASPDANVDARREPFHVLTMLQFGEGVSHMIQEPERRETESSAAGRRTSFAGR
jgi:hypothetical protein